MKKLSNTLSSNEIVRNNIKYYRITKGFTQEKISELLGINEKSYSNLETGRYNISLDRLDEISNILEWKNISGPKYKSMDQGYEFDIITKLLPKFKEYGLSVPLSPVRKEPGMLHFVMYDKDYDRISLDFYNVHEDITNENKYNNPLLVKVSYLKWYSPKEQK